MKKLTTGILALALIAATTTAFACEEGHQGKRKHWRKSGEFTKEERQVMREGFKKHRELKESLKADGELSEEDRAKLKESRETLRKQAQELASNDQRREKKKKEAKQ